MSQVAESKLCLETGKHRHKSRVAAQAHLRSAVEQNILEGVVVDRVVYSCKYCLGWHIGRQKKSAHKNKYRV